MSKEVKVNLFFIHSLVSVKLSKKVMVKLFRSGTKNRKRNNCKTYNNRTFLHRSNDVENHSIRPHGYF